MGTINSPRELLAYAVSQEHTPIYLGGARNFDPLKEPAGTSLMIYQDWLYKCRRWQEQMGRSARRARVAGVGIYPDYSFKKN